MVSSSQEDNGTYLFHVNYGPRFLLIRASLTEKECQEIEGSPGLTLALRALTWALEFRKKLARGAVMRAQMTLVSPVYARNRLTTR